jgi:hypothetical protein
MSVATHFVECIPAVMKESQPVWNYLRRETYMPDQKKSGGATDTLEDQIIGGGEASDRSGKGGKSGGGMGGQDAGGVKGGGKRKTHVGNKKGSPGGITSD